MRTGEARGLKRWMPPSGRSFWNKLNWLSQAISLVHLHHYPSWCYSCMLHEWGTGYHCAMESGYPSSHHCLSMWGLTGLGLHEQPCMPNWDSTSSHVQTFPLLSSPSCQLGVHSLGSSLILNTQSRITSPTVHLMINLVRSPMPKLLKPMSAVGTAHHRAMENCLRHHQTPNNSVGTSGSTEEHNSKDNTNHHGYEST